jgi:hypothetical protein
VHYAFAPPQPSTHKGFEVFIDPVWTVAEIKRHIATLSREQGELTLKRWTVWPEQRGTARSHLSLYRCNCRDLTTYRGIPSLFVVFFPPSLTKFSSRPDGSDAPGELCIIFRHADNTIRKCTVLQARPPCCDLNHRRAHKYSAPQSPAVGASNLPSP